MARRLIGLDIGTNAVRVAELELSDPPRLTSFGQVALPPGAMRDGEVVDPAAVTAAIQRLWKELSLKKAPVRVGVASPRVLVRTVDLPTMSDDELAGALQFQAQDLIPIPLEDAVLDFQVLESLPMPEAGRRRPAAPADVAGPARGGPQGPDPQPHRRRPRRRALGRRGRPRPAGARALGRPAGLGQRRRGRGDREHRRRRDRRRRPRARHPALRPHPRLGRPLGHRRGGPRPRAHHRPGRGRQAADGHRAGRPRRARPARDGATDLGPRRADPRLARLLPHAAGLDPSAQGHAHRRRRAHARSRRPARRHRRRARRPGAAARAHRGRRHRLPRRPAAVARPVPARAGRARARRAAHRQAHRPARRRASRSRSTARSSSASARSRRRCCSSLLGGLYFLKKSQVDDERDKLARGRGDRTAQLQSQISALSDVAQRQAADRDARGADPGAARDRRRVVVGAPGALAHDPVRRVAHVVPGQPSPATGTSRRRTGTGAPHRRGDDRAARSAPANFAAVGTSFDAVAAWIRASAPTFPTSPTSGCPSAAKSGAAAGEHASTDRERDVLLDRQPDRQGQERPGRRSSR